MGPKTPSQPTSSVVPVTSRRDPGAWVAPQLRLTPRWISRINLLGLDPLWRQIALGGLILGAVGLDAALRSGRR